MAYVPGTLLAGTYVVTDLIGAGGFGSVYRATHRDPDLDPRTFALKVMDRVGSNEAMHQLARREVARMLRLNHPGIVRCHGVAVTEAGELALVMEFVKGVVLKEHVTPPGLAPRPMRPVDVITLATPVLLALEACHSAGVVHRDIAPDNILLRHGDAGQPVLIDFGIAKDMDPNEATVIGDRFAGKLGYVAPEQFGLFGREIGPWTDIYSTALVLAFALTGESVLASDSQADGIEKRQRLPDLRSVPPWLQVPLQKALAPAPQDRVRSAAGFLSLLQQASGADGQSLMRTVILGSSGETVFIPAGVPLAEGTALASQPSLRPQGAAPPATAPTRSDRPSQQASAPPGALPLRNAPDGRRRASRPLPPPADEPSGSALGLLLKVIVVVALLLGAGYGLIYVGAVEAPPALRDALQQMGLPLPAPDAPETAP